MATIPIKESGDSWSFRDGNVPFALENAVYTSGDDTLTATVGAGRARWGDTVYELAAATNDFTATAPTAGTYYVYVDHSAQTVSVSQTAPGPGDSPIAELQFDGTSVTSSTDVRSFTPQATGLLTQDGSTARPAWSFDSDPDTGLYRTTVSGGDALGFAVAGFETATLDSGGLDIAGGLTANDITVDSLTLNGDDITSSSGMTLDASGDLYFRTFGSTRGFYDDSLDAWRWYNGGIGEVIRMDGGDLRMVGGGQIRISTASPGAPGLAFDSDPNTGIYSSTGGNINFVSNGNNALIVTPFAVSSNEPIRSADGGFGNAGYGFSTDPSTGMYRDTSANLAFTVEGTKEVTIGSTGIIIPNVNSNFGGSGDNTVLVSDNGQLHIDTSTERFKSNVRTVQDRPSILGLRGQEFDKNDLEGNPRARIGLIAEHVAELWPEAGRYDSEGQVEDYDDRAVLAMIVEELHTLRSEVDALQPA